MLMLTDRETNWDNQQEMKLKLWLTQKLKMVEKQRITLKQCWLPVSHGGGLCVSVDELQLILRQNPDGSEKTIKTEMAFYSHTF